MLSDDLRTFDLHNVLFVQKYAYQDGGSSGRYGNIGAGNPIWRSPYPSMYETQ